MSASNVRCHVIDKDVAVVTDIEGNVKNISCEFFNRSNFVCKKKLSEQGIISSFTTAIADRVLDTRMRYCEFTEPDENPTAKLMIGNCFFL